MAPGWTSPPPASGGFLPSSPPPSNHNQSHDGHDHGHGHDDHPDATTITAATAASPPPSPPPPPPLTTTTTHQDANNISTTTTTISYHPGSLDPNPGPGPSLPNSPISTTSTSSSSSAYPPPDLPPSSIVPIPLFPSSPTLASASHTQTPSLSSPFTVRRKPLPQDAVNPSHAARPFSSSSSLLASPRGNSPAHPDSHPASPLAAGQTLALSPVSSPSFLDYVYDRQDDEDEDDIYQHTPEPYPEYTHEPQQQLHRPVSPPRDLDRFPRGSPSSSHLRIDTTSSIGSPVNDSDDETPVYDIAYSTRFTNATRIHNRLVSESFVHKRISPAINPKRATTMALHLPTNGPAPLQIDPPRRTGTSSTMGDSKQPKTPGNKISSFFGWRAGNSSPGAESSSTDISESGRSPIPSPMPPSLPSASFSITPSTTVPFDPTRPHTSLPHRNSSLSSASILEKSGAPALVAELENELREISSELAGSIRREMELEDLVERLQSDSVFDTPNRRTSDYFSDSGSSSIRYAYESGGRVEDIEKYKRTAEQERAQIKVELSQKLQEERGRRAASEAHVQILESQVHQLRRERVDLSDMSSRTKELETALEATRRKLAEERQIKDNFEDLLTAMRVELEQLRNERDHLKENVIPQLQSSASNSHQQSSDPSEVARLMGEIEALKIENASLAQLQGSRFASIAEEDTMSPARGTGLGLSRSNSLARVRSKPSAPTGLSRSNSLSRSSSVNVKERSEPRENLADRIEDVEAQRDALHEALRRLLERQAYDSREYEKQLKIMELELARAQMAESPRKIGYEREVRNLREEVNLLRHRAEEAMEQKWQCEKGLAGLKMDLDRAEQETTSLRVLLQEHDITVPEDYDTDRDGFAEVLVTSSSLETAYKQLQADRDQAEANVAQSPMLAESVTRTDSLAEHVKQQLANNIALRARLAEAIGKGEKEQQLSATRINEMQSRLKEMEDILLMAQQFSEDEMARHEEEVRNLQESHSLQLTRVKNGARSPMALSPKPPNTPFGARSPRLDKTTSGDGMALNEAVQFETLAKRVKELEKLLRDADSEMEEVVSRMNRAQIEVAELQSDRDEALRQTRKLQAEILAEREALKTLIVS